ncbi:unnamed protein product [Prorocentrum cordatum]|uniref:Mannosyltransferase n=1 Tax=Prorocentrum cordatum TaxID=2364126 RepID=A0ABN9SJD4_9DINO|nr:unnamed protein product [Polarella glacialis]
MSPLWNAVEVAWHADGSLWVSVNAWALPVLALFVVLGSQLRATELLRKCFGRRMEYRRLAFIVVIIAYVGRAGLVLPVPQLGKAIEGQHYTIHAWQFEAARASWFAGDDNKSVEHIHVAAEHLASTFVLSEKDDDTEQFLTRCAEAAQSWAGRVTVYVKQKIYHSKSGEVLGWTRTDASAFVDRSTIRRREHDININF